MSSFGIVFKRKFWPEREFARDFFLFQVSFQISIQICVFFSRGQPIVRSFALICQRMTVTGQWTGATASKNN